MKRIKLVSIVGARPQFIKAAAISAEIRKTNKISKHKINEIILHTGQHYDIEMSQLFFRQLKLPKPHYNLGIKQKIHWQQIASMIFGIEKVLTKERPNLVMIFGDTNSTIAGALAASKLCIPIAHVEAGLRSFNKQMVEEANRIITDKLSNFLFCPTRQSIFNLRKEGIGKNVYLVGDVMKDMLLKSLAGGCRRSKILKSMSLTPLKYYLATVHRAENVDCKNNLKNLMGIFGGLNKKVVLPLHPRTKRNLKRYKIKIAPQIIITTPVSYFDMLTLEKNSKAILTDSGGIQKEAFLLGKPCLILREETEWTEAVLQKKNILTGINKNKILNAIKKLKNDNFLKAPRTNFYGDGCSAKKIINIISNKIRN